MKLICTHAANGAENSFTKGMIYESNSDGEVVSDNGFSWFVRDDGTLHGFDGTYAKFKMLGGNDWSNNLS